MTEKLAARSPSLKARMAGAGARKTVYPSVPSTPEQIKDLPIDSTRSPRHMLPHDVAKWQWENKLEPRYKGDKLSSANPFLAGFLSEITKSATPTRLRAARAVTQRVLQARPGIDKDKALSLVLGDTKALGTFWDGSGVSAAPVKKSMLQKFKENAASGPQPEAATPLRKSTDADVRRRAQEAADWAVHRKVVQLDNPLLPKGVKW